MLYYSYSLPDLMLLYKQNSYKAEQDKEVLRFGDKCVESDRLFIKWNGEPIPKRSAFFRRIAHLKKSMSARKSQ